LLLRQLAPGGRLVAPIGYDDEGQVLTLVTAAGDAGYTPAAILPVRFMRLPGGERL
jgi:protein-L-isoaspartate O-methyltransferase